MEKTTEEFISKLSDRSQKMINNKLFTETMLTKFFADHAGDCFIDDFGLPKRADDNRVIGELEILEIELIAITEFLLARIIRQKEIIQDGRYYLESVEEETLNPRIIRDAQNQHAERNERLSVLFTEYGVVLNYVNYLIRNRLKGKIDTLLKKDSGLQKKPYHYYTSGTTDIPGFTFRVCRQKEIVMDNMFVMGGD